MLAESLLVKKNSEKKVKKSIRKRKLVPPHLRWRKIWWVPIYCFLSYFAGDIAQIHLMNQSINLLGVLTSLFVFLFQSCSRVYQKFAPFWEDFTKNCEMLVAHFCRKMWSDIIASNVTWSSWLLQAKLIRALTVNMYGLLTKCEVKMAGYWPSSFFACLWTETKSRSINSQKKERGQYPAILTEQTWSIKDLLYGFCWNFACGIQRVAPSGQDGSILPARVANHSARFGSSCPLAELAI